MARKVIIDTDPGVDDLLAIAIALNSHRVRVMGLTTVYGNTDIENTTANALHILEVAGRTDIPVARGASKPWESEFDGGVPEVQGEFGLGDCPRSEPSTEPVAKDAADFIYEMATAHPGEISLFAIGPLTNIADAAKRYPDLPDLVEQLVIMGGNAWTMGNASPTAEANILHDPEAADFVLGLDWPAVMIGLDITQSVILAPEEITVISEVEGEFHSMMADAMAFYHRFHLEYFDNVDGIYPHDATAFLWFLKPHLFEFRLASVRVETESISRGKTWPAVPNATSRTGPWEGRPSVKIPSRVFARAAAWSLVDMLSGLEFHDEE